MTDTNGAVDNDHHHHHHHHPQLQLQQNDGGRRPDNHIDYHSQLFSSLNLNDITIEDIEEVIEKDKVGGRTTTTITSASSAASAAAVVRVADDRSDVVANDIMASGGVGSSRGRGRGGGSVSSSSLSASSSQPQPETKILIEPAQKALRFRYVCEGRSAGSIPGANSTLENKTYPTIQVLNYRGEAAVVVSCVTKDKPYRPHPHKLVGKEGCKRGICTVTINNENMICSFPNLGIQCVKRKDIEEALQERAKANVDPFLTSSTHKNQVVNIDLNAVRLCFQVFLPGDKGFTKPLQPVVSDPIFDKKSMCDLVICKLSACSASVWGGAEIIVLCEKIVRDDIQVRFFETRDDQVVWEGFGDFQPSDVHKQVAISLKTPKYSDTEVTHPVELFIQLRRPSDGTSSEPRAFQFLPADSDPEGLKHKRQKIAKTSFGLYLAENAGATKTDLRASNLLETGGTVRQTQRPIRHPQRTRIKIEPPDTGYGTGYPVQQLAQAIAIDPRQLPPYYGAGPSTAAAAASNMMDITPSNIPMSGYDQQNVPATSSQHFYPLNTVGQHSVLTHLPHHQQQPQQRTQTPEVVTIPSYSSSGGSNPMYSGMNPVMSGHSSGGRSGAEGQQPQQINLSSGSSRLSLGIGSLGSLPLSESTLSIIGSHLSDTFLCLNPDSIDAQLMNSGEGREPSMDSFSGLLNQLNQLNQMGADEDDSAVPEHR